MIKYLAIILLWVPQMVSATEVYWEQQYDIVAMFPTTTGVSVQISPNPPRCSSSWWDTQLVIRSGTANYNTLVAGMTSAMMANKKITTIHVEPLGTGDCSNGNELDVVGFKIVN